jgi:hypothetical protein
MIAEFQPPRWISLVVLFALAAVFAASWWMFFALAHQWTEARPWHALSEWAKDHGFRFARAADAPAMQSAAPPLPSPIDVLKDHQPQMVTTLTSVRQQVVEFRWRPPPLTQHAPVASPGPRPDSEGWLPGHVLLQMIDDSWPPLGLRPALHATSMLDLFTSGGGATMGESSERFTILGHDPAAARLLLASSVRALLPADVGFLLYGNTLLLDFSARPFDPIELDRMLAVAAQVAEHVPPLPAIAGE